MRGPLRKYKVTTAQGVETVMKLTEEDAKQAGGVPLEQAPAEPSAPAAPAPEAKKRAAPRNKARGAAGAKGGGE